MDNKLLCCIFHLFTLRLRRQVSLSLSSSSEHRWGPDRYLWAAREEKKRERKKETEKNREIVELEKKKKRTIFLHPVVLCQIRSLWGLATHSDRNPIFPVFKKSSVFLHLSLGETRSSLQHPPAFSSFSKRPRKSNFSPSATCASSLAQVSGFCWWITDCDTLSSPQHFWNYWTP